MTQSMTGFASKIVEISNSKTEKLSLSLHLKALNSRYFEMTCKLPSLLSHYEVAIHRILKKKLERGHVYLIIKVQNDATQHLIMPSKPIIQQYLQAIEQIQKICKIKESVSLATILLLPNIFQIEEKFDYQLFTDQKITGGCSRRRPDVAIDLYTHIIILECDEEQHQNYNCENKRVMEIFQDFNEGDKFIF